VGRNCRDTWVGDLRVPFLNLPTVPSGANKRRALKEDCQPGFYRCDDDIAGIFRSRLGQTLFIDPPAAPPVRTGGCPERGANRASTGVATIVRGSSGPGSSRHRFSTHRRYPPCEQGDTQDKLHQPGFYRCGKRRTKMRPTGLLPEWPRSCSRRFVPGSVRRPGLPVTATTLPANRILIKIFTHDTNWVSPPPFPDRSGPTHNIGSASAAQNLAVVPLRISWGRQYRRLLLADRSKPVSAGRGLPTLTLPAHPGTTPTDRRDQEASHYGRTRDIRSHPSCHPRCFLSLSEGVEVGTCTLNPAVLMCL